jgi:hypothetical protein
MKGLQFTKRYEATKNVRKVIQRLRNKLRKTMVAKLPSYEIVTPPIGIIYYDAGPTVSELQLG